MEESDFGVKKNICLRKSANKSVRSVQQLPVAPAIHLA